MAAWGERLAGVRGVLLDISGVLYDGGEGGGAPIVGSVEALASLGSPETPSPVGSSETHFLASRGISEDGRGFADMVVVATSKGTLSRVHGHTPHTWPAIPLCLILVVGTAGLQNGFVNAATSSHHTDHNSVGGGDDLLGAQGQLHSGLLCLRVVGDDSHIVSRGYGQLAPVTTLLLQTTHVGAPRYGTHREHTTDAELGLLATVHELAGVDALGGDEHLCPLLKTVWIPEDHLGKGHAAARVVDGVLHDTLDVAVLLGKVHGVQRRGVFRCFTCTRNVELAPFLCPQIPWPMAAVC
uniref:Phospholysine phosphohistidine inorganic pyrophosphate phosphatase isoform X1 n=1 Tax=Tursiops truncatus TaxID=9739 RepID=A0A6J3Q892_TURTR|nr:phospholysine phosphohistidine inorganic pyrophosphate phosphatase isoform X1 [Tursiops truncatus]